MSGRPVLEMANVGRKLCLTFTFGTLTFLTSVTCDPLRPRVVDA